MARAPLFPRGLGWVIPFIQSAVATGQTIGELLSSLSLQPLEFSESAVTQAYNYLAGVKLTNEEYIQRLQQFAIPNALRIPVGLTAQTHNYYYLIELSGFKVGTTELGTAQVILRSNDLISKQDALDTMEARLSETGRVYEVEGFSASVVGITSNPAGLV